MRRWTEQRADFLVLCPWFLVLGPLQRRDDSLFDYSRLPTKHKAPSTVMTAAYGHEKARRFTKMEHTALRPAGALTWAGSMTKGTATNQFVHGLSISNRHVFQAAHFCGKHKNATMYL